MCGDHVPSAYPLTDNACERIDPKYVYNIIHIVLISKELSIICIYSGVINHAAMLLRS